MRVSELQRWAEHGSVAEPRPARARSRPRPTKGLSAEHLKFNLHADVEELRFRRLSRLAWATLYQRVFAIDPSTARAAADRMRIVEVIQDVVRQQRASPSNPARAATAAVSRARPMASIEARAPLTDA